jgi:putative addiction module killer protein
MITIREFSYEDGSSPFADWFDDLDPQTAARVTVALTRIELGNMPSVKGVGDGVFESRIQTGPGIRIYFGKDGDTLVILLAGGTKRRQQKDIEDAKSRWKSYKERKRDTQR